MMDPVAPPPPPAAFVPIKPRVRRRRRRPQGPSAGPSVTVISVSIFDDVWTDWQFSRPVTLLDPSWPWAMFVIDTSNGTQSPSEGIQVGPSTIRFHFDDGGLAGGQAWRLTGPTPPAKLDFQGAVLAVPESGIVTEE